MRRSRLSAVAVAVAMLAAAAGLSAARSGAARGAPKLPRGSERLRIDPADFSPRIDNRRWPMAVGSRWVYRVTNTETGHAERQVITVTKHTKLMADGVRARVVRDVVTDHGRPVEVTEDWYAQDPRGDVWYFGEHTTAYRHGKASDNGTWQAGRPGAMPGVALPAKPDISGGSDREELISYTH